MDCKSAQSMVTRYVKRELKDKELEEFVHHIGKCKECHEELEIYFTIHFALQKLDEDKNVSYNIKQMLEDDLEAAKRKVKIRKILRIYSYGVMFLAEILLTLVLLTQIELWNSGTIKETFVYRMVYGNEIETESEIETELEMGGTGSKETKIEETKVEETNPGKKK